MEAGERKRRSARQRRASATSRRALRRVNVPEMSPMVTRRSAAVLTAEHRHKQRRAHRITRELRPAHDSPRPSASGLRRLDVFWKSLILPSRFESSGEQLPNANLLSSLRKIEVYL